MVVGTSSEYTEGGTFNSDPSQRNRMTDWGQEGDPKLIAALPRLDADFYLCGPATFMAEVQAALEAGGVPAEAIHTESVGPVSG